MNLIEMWDAIVRHRKEGRKCSDAYVVTAFDRSVVLPNALADLRRCWWSTQARTLQDAYVAGWSAVQRLHFAPFLWAMPEDVSVGQGKRVPMRELLRVAIESRRAYLNSLGYEE